MIPRTFFLNETHELPPIKKRAKQSELRGWYLELRQAVLDEGFEEEVKWAENIKAPLTPEALALEAIYVICNSGMKAQVARGIYDRVVAWLRGGEPSGFGHAGKLRAISWIWKHKERLFLEFKAAPRKVDWCDSLPFIGGITKWHLAKNLGVDVVKPDRHLVRMAEAMKYVSPQVLCDAISSVTGAKVATIDTVIWRACNLGILESKASTES